MHPHAFGHLAIMKNREAELRGVRSMGKEYHRTEGWESFLEEEEIDSVKYRTEK